MWSTDKGEGEGEDLEMREGDDDGVLELAPHYQYISGLRCAHSLLLFPSSNGQLWPQRPYLSGRYGICSPVGCQVHTASLATTLLLTAHLFTCSPTLAFTPSLTLTHTLTHSYTRSLTHSRTSVVPFHLAQFCAERQVRRSHH